MATTNLGRVGFVLKGEFTAGQTYKTLDVVHYGTATYACRTTTTTAAPTNQSAWQLLAQDDAAVASELVTAEALLDQTIAGVTFATDLAQLAARGIMALRQQQQQEGEVTIRNRGVVSGCGVSKSTTASRNLSIDAGVCFALGHRYPVNAAANAASVPANTGTGAATVYAYLYPGSSGDYRLAVTGMGEAVPGNGITLYNLTIPPNNTATNDPNLASVTLTSVRRIESLFPKSLDAPVDTYIPINKLAASDYRVDIDVVSADGAPCRNDDVLPISRATNGLTLRLASAADNVLVRWRVSRLKN